jgi:hypothetical protein
MVDRWLTFQQEVDHLPEVRESGVGQSLVSAQLVSERRGVAIWDRCLNRCRGGLLAASNRPYAATEGDSFVLPRLVFEGPEDHIYPRFVDAVVVQGRKRDCVRTLRGADDPIGAWLPLAERAPWVWAPSGVGIREASSRAGVPIPPDGRWRASSPSRSSTS